MEQIYSAKDLATEEPTHSSAFSVYDRRQAAMGQMEPSRNYFEWLFLKVSPFPSIFNTVLERPDPPPQEFIVFQSLT